MIGATRDYSERMSIFREHVLAGKTALVTGGGSGIGQRMAERFAEHGAKVMLVGRKQEKLDAAAAIGFLNAAGSRRPTRLTCAIIAGVEAAI